MSKSTDWAVAGYNKCKYVGAAANQRSRGIVARSVAIQIERMSVCIESVWTDDHRSTPWRVFEFCAERDDFEIGVYDQCTVNPCQVCEPIDPAENAFIQCRRIEGLLVALKGRSLCANFCNLE